MNVVNIVPMSSSAPPPRHREHPHVTVLRAETIAALAPRAGGTYLDVTLGGGGHTEAILEVDGTRVWGADRDASALELARRRLARFGDRLQTVQASFSELPAALRAAGVEQVDGIVADLGVSSMQLDEPARGLSFRSAGPLDMRMDASRGETALELIDRLDDDELANVIYRYGEERRSRRVARCIKQARAAGELESTLDLRRAVVRAVGPARIGGLDPATRTFQALRMAVNQELEEIEALLAAAVELVAPDGVLAVIAFHSLEDRLVKHALRDRSRWQPLTKKPVGPSDAEVEDNPRARSAKLRAARRNDGHLALVAGARAAYDDDAEDTET